MKYFLKFFLFKEYSLQKCINDVPELIPLFSVVILEIQLDIQLRSLVSVYIQF